MSAFTEPVAILRPNLLAHLQQPTATSLAALIGWDDVAGLQRALDGQACGLDLLAYLVRHFAVLPLSYFAVLARDERREVVGWLAGEGMSTRAIAPIVGASFKTVARDLEAGPVSDDTPAQPPTIATTEGVVIAEQRRVEPTAFVVGPGIDGALDVTDWSEDEIAEVMDDDNAGVTYSNEPIPEAIPEPKPIIGKDGKTYQRPAPKPERRKPLPESFDSATYALKRAIEPLARLAADDRMEKNKDQIASVNLSDLIRVRDSLTGVINQLQGA